MNNRSQAQMKNSGDGAAPAAFAVATFGERTTGNTSAGATTSGSGALLDKTNACSADAVPVSDFSDAELTKLEERIAAEKSRRGLVGGSGGDDDTRAGTGGSRPAAADNGAVQPLALAKWAAKADSNCHKTQFEINAKKLEKKWRGKITYKITSEYSALVKRKESALGHKEPKMNQKGLYDRAKAKWEERRGNCSDSDDGTSESREGSAVESEEGIVKYDDCDSFPGMYMWAREHYFGPTTNHDTIIHRIANHWTLPEAIEGFPDGQKPACLLLGLAPKDDDKAVDEYNSFILSKIWDGALKQVQERVTKNASGGPVMRADVSNVASAASARSNDSNPTARLLLAAEQRAQDDLDLEQERIDLNTRHSQIRRRRNAEEKNARLDAISEMALAKVANEAETIAMEDAVLWDEADKFDKSVREEAEVADEENWSAQEKIANDSSSACDNAAHYIGGAYEKNTNRGGTAFPDLATACDPRRKFAEYDYVTLENGDTCMKGYICAVNVQDDGTYLYDINIYWKDGISVDDVSHPGVKEDYLENDPNPTHLC